MGTTTAYVHIYLPADSEVVDEQLNDNANSTLIDAGILSEHNLILAHTSAISPHTGHAVLAAANLFQGLQTVQVGADTPGLMLDTPGLVAPGVLTGSRQVLRARSYDTVQHTRDFLWRARATSNAGAGVVELLTLIDGGAATTLWSMTSAGVLHVTSPVVDSGGLAVMAGNIGIGVAPISQMGIYMPAAMLLTGATQGFGGSFQPTFSSSFTLNIAGVFSAPNTQAAVFTCPSVASFWAANPGKGAGSTITTAYGLIVDPITSGNTNNYGISVGAPSGGSGSNIGIYNGGMSQLVGNVGIGTPPSSNAALQVSESVTSASGSAFHFFSAGSLFAAANNDALVGLRVNPSFNNGAFTGVTNLGAWISSGLRVDGNVGIGVAPIPLAGLTINTSLTGTNSTGLVVQPTLAAAASIDNLYAVQVAPAFVPGAFTTAMVGLQVAGNTASQAASTKYGLIIGAQTGANTNNYGIFVSAPTGASVENYAIKAFGVSQFAALTLTGELAHQGSTAGFFNHAPSSRQAVGAAATDLASAIVLVNNLRAAFQGNGLVG